MAQSPPDDRREHIRFDVAIPVLFNDLKALREETTANLSRGGCLVASKTSRPLNTRVPIVLVHPVSGQKLELEANVKRVAPMADGRFWLGVQFVGFDDVLRERLHAFVDSVTEKAMRTPVAPWESKGAGTLDQYLRAASEAATAGDKAEAVRQLDFALAIDPGQKDLWALRGKLASQAREEKAALPPPAPKAALPTKPEGPRWTAPSRRLILILGLAVAAALWQLSQIDW